MITTIAHRLNRSGIKNIDKFLRDLVFDVDFFLWVRKRHGDLDWFGDLHCRCDDLIHSKNQGRISKLLKLNPDFLELAHQYLTSVD